MFGWQGTILAIDLTRRQVTTMKPDPQLYHRYIGGRGLAGAFLAEKATLPWDNPESPLLVFTGPLTGTVAPTSGRYTIMGRSPLTGTIGDSSTGGDLGIELKKGGVDGLIITGKSDSLTGISISDGAVTFEDAEYLRGLTTDEIFQRMSHFGTLTTTGPAADTGVLFAGIVSDRGHFAGRNGLGALMASKNLKFLTARGSGQTAVADRDRILEARQEILR
ncbi:aldehyde ferredoxin oxidoreductase, partial [Myxococcota bacterium]|nr:aldehyde ferredoxin oxidoreductase [Myxococcota bacterium]